MNTSHFQPCADCATPAECGQLSAANAGLHCPESGDVGSILESTHPMVGAGIKAEPKDCAGQCAGGSCKEDREQIEFKAIAVEVARLSLKPGDVLVVGFAHALTNEQSAHVHQHFAHILPPGVGVLVKDASVELSVLESAAKAEGE